MAAPVKQPIVIIVLGADIGYKAFGCTGNRYAHPPSIDRLAQAGLVFDQLYTTVAACCPARTELYTRLFCFLITTGFTQTQFLSNDPALKASLNFSSRSATGSV